MIFGGKRESIRILIKKFLKRQLHYVRRVSSPSNLRYDYNQHILVLQMMCLTVFIALFYALFNWSYDMKMSTYLDIALASLALASVWIMSTGRFQLGRYMFLFSILTCISLIALIEGPHSGNQFLWYVILAGMFAFTPFKDYRFLIIGSIALLLSIGVCEALEYALIPPPDTIGERDGPYYLLALGISIGIVFYFSAVSLRNTWKLFDNKDRANQVLSREKVKLTQSNQTFENLLDQVSHDLRAPIQNMRGLISVAENTNGIEKVKEIIALQENNLQVLEKNIDGIINEIKERNMEIPPGLIQFDPLIRDMVSQHYFMIREKSIDFKTRIDNQFPFYTRENAIKAILSNLISNGIKYSDHTKPKSFIQLAVEDMDANKLKIRYEDNGIGIETGELHKITEKFYTSSTNPQANHNTGIGLYLTNNAVQNIQGEISIQSEPGKFTRIDIVLPNLKSA